MARTSRLVCKSYTKGKQYEVKLGNNGERQATKPLEIVHLGVCGSMRNMSVEEIRYLVIFIDDFY